MKVKILFVFFIILDIYFCYWKMVLDERLSRYIFFWDFVRELVFFFRFFILCKDIDLINKLFLILVRNLVGILKVKYIGVMFDCGGKSNICLRVLNNRFFKLFLKL